MNNPEEIEVLIKIEEVARRLSLKTRAIQHMVNRRAIPAVKLNRRCVRFRWSDVQRALDRVTVRELR